MIDKTLTPQSMNRSSYTRGSYESLDTPVQYLKGVGPQRAETLKKLGLQTVEDLIFHFPRDHQNRTLIPIRDTRPGSKEAIEGEVLYFDVKQTGRQLGIGRAILRDETGTIQALWFKHLSYQYDVFAGLKKRVQPGSRLRCYGAIEEGQEGRILRVEDFDSTEVPWEDAFPTSIVPVYPLTEGIQDRWLRQLIVRVVQLHAHHIQDPLPMKLQQEHNLLPLKEAIQKYHLPANWVERDKARERLAFDEFFLMELALAVNRHNRDKSLKGFSNVIKRYLLTPFRQNLGYEFTRAQTRVINEIFQDMELPKPMNRLLQGDVGSGKTVVALSAALLAIENEFQVAFLAPTEILAEQHGLTIAKFFEGLPIKWAVLTASVPKAKRDKILSDLKGGKINLIIGTHALFHEDVQFKKLGLVVVDEQHRFGVQQRAKLVYKSTEGQGPASFYSDLSTPDVLIMTATPIPRTLALTVYGDLDVSTLDEMPQGRASIKSQLEPLKQVIHRTFNEIQKGHQAYIVFPLIEESEKVSKRSGRVVKAAKVEFEKIQNQFEGFSTALLHGQMNPDEKRQTMDAFRKGDISILVATPVIEVGIDVSNATVMIIHNPERFGLAQLHQLRGRVGRGPYPSECFLVDHGIVDKSRERLESFCAISDGFRLAEEDLKFRGPGEFLGEAQHGLPFFRVGNLIYDSWIILQTRKAALSLVDGTMPLTMKEFGNLNNNLRKKFGPRLNLSNIG
jgi:ATP-dependent DNA helicase RecG